MELEDQVMVILAGTSGYADKVPVDKMSQWQTDLLRFMASSHPEVGKEIVEKKALSDGLRSRMATAFATFSSTWQG